MDVSEIISVLRKAEHVYEGDYFPREGYYDNHLVMELDQDQNRLYNAILKTIPKETLAKVNNELTNCAASFADKVEWMSKDHKMPEFRHNEPVSILLKYLMNKSSKKVGYARGCLTKRFEHQSYRDQNKILRAFLQGTGGDCDWAARRLRDNWRKELTKEVKSAWEKTHRLLLSYVVLRHLPKIYILQQQESLAEVAGYHHVCAEIGNEPEFIMDETRLSTPDYLYVMAKLGRSVDFEMAEKSIYDFLLHYDKYYSFPCYPSAFSSIDGWDRMVWAMGQLGMQDALVHLLEFENKVKEKVPKDSDYENAQAYFVAAIKDAIEPNNDMDRLSTERENLQKALRDHFGPIINEPEEYPVTKSVTIGDLFEKKLEDNPEMSLKDEWDFFADCFYNDKPRLQAMMKEAHVTEELGRSVIILPVRSSFQLDWLLAGPLDEMRELFARKTTRKESDYTITTEHIISDETL